MNTQEVLADRIKALEDNSHLLEKRLVAAVQTIQRLRHDITVGRIERKRKNFQAAEIAVVVLASLLPGNTEWLAWESAGEKSDSCV